MAEHSPTSSIIGVAGVGTGVLLLYCAYKNVNPWYLIRQVVTTGNIDTSKLPGFFDPSLVSPAAGPIMRDAEKLMHGDAMGGPPHPELEPLVIAIQKWITTGQGDIDGILKDLDALHAAGNPMAGTVAEELRAYRQDHPQGEKTGK